jgi:hypothetical protein
MISAGIKTIVFSVVALFMVSGCASLQEGTRGFLGTSVKPVEASRKTAVKRSIAGDYPQVYANVLAELQKAGYYVYRQDAQAKFIAFYFSTEDTTVCGVFFSQAEPGHTEIEIASPSSYLRDAVAAKLAVLPSPKKKEIPVVESETEQSKPELKGIPIDGQKQPE